MKNEEKTANDKADNVEDVDEAGQSPLDYMAMRIARRLMMTPPSPRSTKSKG